jgi:hypothetical protein
MNVSTGLILVLDDEPFRAETLAETLARVGALGLAITGLRRVPGQVDDVLEGIGLEGEAVAVHLAQIGGAILDYELMRTSGVVRTGLELLPTLLDHNIFVVGTSGNQDHNRRFVAGDLARRAHLAIDKPRLGEALRRQLAGSEFLPWLTTFDPSLHGEVLDQFYQLFCPGIGDPQGPK